jgi:hypothetical protein
MLRKTKYRDFNDHHFAKNLATETPPLPLSAATVRRVLRAAGVSGVWQRRPRATAAAAIAKRKQA